MNAHTMTGATVDELLHHAVHQAGGGTVRILEIRRRPWAYGSSHQLESIELQLDDGSTFELLAKTHVHGGTGVPGEDARDARREVVAYSKFLREGDTGAPAFYGAIRDASSTTLLLERIEGTELYQLGDPEAWFAAARWLARLHARFHDATKATGLLDRDRAWYEMRWQRALEVADRSDEGSDARVAMLEADYFGAVDRLLELPRTIVHGEFYPANILVQSSPKGPRIRPVDWEMAGLAPGVLDLAALVAGRWSEAQRDAMTRAYRDATAAGAAGDDTAFRRSLDDARLVLAVQWLGWAEDWDPPGEQANDWLAEAMRAARRAA